MRRFVLLLPVFVLLIGAAQERPCPTYILDIRDIDGVPVLFEKDMPYFTRTTSSDHETLDLAGTWKFKRDTADSGEKNGWYKPGFDDSSWYDHPVPGSWNVQKEEWLYYEGAGWYRRSFDVPSSMCDNGWPRLVMDGVAYKGDVYVNGEFAGSHQGGFSRWSLDLSGKLHCGQENHIAVRVDNRRDYDTLPPLVKKGAPLGWWFYGGINREAVIEKTPDVSLCKLAVRTSHTGRLEGQGVVYNHSRKYASAVVDLELQDKQGNKLAEVGTFEVAVSGDGASAFRFDKNIDGIRPWSTENPENRYLLEIKVDAGGSKEKQVQEIGFKTFEFRGNRAYLNGRPIYLRGINRHEDFPRTGAVDTKHWIEKDQELLEKLNVNFMRPAHYPHDPKWLDACDKNGVMITHEIPLYQVPQSIKNYKAVRGDKLYRNAARQLIETIERDRNHPCVVMWSVGNENQTYMPSLKKLQQRLMKAAKKFDPHRYVTFAVFTTPPLSPHIEFSAETADVLFINEYFGWYYKEPEDLGPYLDEVHAKWPDKPLVLSEFGAGAVRGRASGQEIRIGSNMQGFTEEYQLELYRTQYREILKRDYVAGTMPWILADFRDGKRGENHPVKDFNLKGLVTHDRQEKKAFRFLADTYGDIKEEYGY